MGQRNKTLVTYDPGEFRRKFNLVIWLMLLAFAFLTGKMWYLQIVKGGELLQRSKDNRIRLQEIRPLRGLILDARGRILVDNQASFDISIIPETAKDVKGVIDRLSSIYDDENIDLARNFTASRKRKPFVPIKLAKNIGRDRLALIETNSLNLPGVMVDVVPVRKYIFGETMAHILGYVGEISIAELAKDVVGDYNAGDVIGKLGIEKTVDRYLKGERGGEQIEVNVSGRKLNVLGRVDAVPGYNIQLTIDADLQKICWDAFQERAGTVITMNPRDGSILSLVNKPSYDPNLFNRGISDDDWRSLLNNPLSPMQNKAISGQYPPGSTYKPFIAAAALEEGVVDPEHKVVCNRVYPVGTRTFRCWSKRGHGPTALHRAITESCDVYFYDIGTKIGVDTLADYARKFGFGIRSGIDLPGERSGLVPTREWKLQRFKETWQTGETVSLTIGQGFVLVTPLQLLRAYCALANGGILYQPQLIKAVKTESDEIVKEFPPVEISRIPVSREHIDILKYALWGAVNEDHGTGRALRRPERDVCGKTGTAQVIKMAQDDEKIKKEDVPYKHRDHALFVCFAPYRDPEIAVVVIVEHGGHGGSAAAPIARKIIDGYFDLKNRGAAVTLPTGQGGPTRREN